MSNSQSLGYLNLELNPEKEPGKLTMIRYDVFVKMLFKEMSREMMICHAAMLVSGEAGELTDALKKHVVYGKELDRDNLVEELGDLRFGIQAVMNLFDISETEILQTNGYKLAKRYAGLSYSDAAAQKRADKLEPGQEAV
jgi:uncharacterized protein YabN with tetrapyrrole methylase and pyrophosphatase domain